jgi:hypothetical protein
MTALPGGTVERTVSGACRERTGLPRVKTHGADRQNLADLIEAFFVGQELGLRVFGHLTGDGYRMNPSDREV